MKKYLLVAIIWLVVDCSSVYGQTLKCGDLFAIQTVDRLYDYGFDTMLWPYVWDLSVQSFEHEFCIFECLDQEIGETSYYAIFLIEDDHDKALTQTFYYKDVNAFYIFPNNAHGALYPHCGSSDLIEYKPERKYDRSYSTGGLTYLFPIKSNQNDFYYSVFDSSNRISEFSLIPITADEIIASNRTYKPSCWTVIYDERGFVKQIKGKDVISNDYTLSFKWDTKLQQIDYSQVKELPYDNIKQYVIHRVGYSSMDQKNRWRKAIIYDYDVIMDDFTPKINITRHFFPYQYLEECINNDFNVKLLSPDICNGIK